MSQDHVDRTLPPGDVEGLHGDPQIQNRERQSVGITDGVGVHG